ncbi:DUF4401 domain-containing protein [Leucothrix sargassi]|nr:DUF4401 domain-containing protein [Leucothrix sargassi]
MSQTLWQQLASHNIVTGDEPNVDSDNAPWYVRTMLGIAGWFGALFLLGALFGAIEILIDSALMSGLLGVSACLVAVLIYRMPKRNDFLQQFAFAVSLAGQSMLVVSVLLELDISSVGRGLVERMHILSIITICLQVLLFFVIKNYMHRMWSALLIALSFMFLLNNYGLYSYSLALLLAAGVVLWLQEFNWAQLGNKLSAPAYALVFVSLLILFAQNFLWPESSFWRNLFGVPDDYTLVSAFAEAILVGALLLGLVLVLLKRAGTPWGSGKGIAAIVLSLVVAYIGGYVPGMTIGTLLALLGFAHGNRVLTSLGLVVLVLFIFQFYYNLELTLLVKSGLLVASGATLLIGRQVMGQLWPKGGERDA